jgi:hypothetical protein
MIAVKTLTTAAKGVRVDWIKVVNARAASGL